MKYSFHYVTRRAHRNVSEVIFFFKWVLRLSGLLIAFVFDIVLFKKACKPGSLVTCEVLIICSPYVRFSYSYQAIYKDCRLNCWSFLILTPFSWDSQITVSLVIIVPVFSIYSLLFPEEHLNEQTCISRHSSWICDVKCVITICMLDWVGCTLQCH